MGILSVVAAVVAGISMIAGSVFEDQITLRLQAILEKLAEEE